MTLTQAPEAHDCLSMDGSWISDEELSQIFDFDGCLPDSSMGIATSSPKELCSQIQPIGDTQHADNIQIVEDIQPARAASPILADPCNSTFDADLTAKLPPGPLMTTLSDLLNNTCQETAAVVDKASKPLPIESCPVAAVMADNQVIHEPPLTKPSEIPAQACLATPLVVDDEAICRTKAIEAKNIEMHLKYLRYKLQQGLLPENQLPKAEDMSAMSVYLKKLEDIANPSRSAVHAAKIHKVLKAIKKLDNIPQEEAFRFKERATALHEKWNAIWSSKEQPTTISIAQHQPEHASKSQVIDLTELSDSEESTQSTSVQAARTDESWSDSKSSNSLSKASIKKRKRFEALDSPTTATASQSNKSTTRRRRNPRTSFQKHLSNESMFMSLSLEVVEGLLEDNTEEMELVRKKKVRLIAFKETLLAWSAQDEKVTKEWERRV